MAKLNGVDVSGWDKGIDTGALTADFVIVKATEGTQGTIYNPDYRTMADAALGSGKLLGFYHYANGGDPVAEADSFYKAIKDYKGRALPCLDWEGQGNRKFGTREDVAWCKQFLDRIATLMGATPVLYTSKGVCSTYDWSSVAAKYPLWGAEYAYENKVYQGYVDTPWQSNLAWGAWGKTPLMHQYGYVNPRPNNGGIAKLDGEVFYGTREDWAKLCKPQSSSAENVKTPLPYAELAAQVCEHFIYHDAHGYSQISRDGDGTVETIKLTDGTEVSFNGGDRDCSRLMQTCYVVVDVLPRGIHMWTGNEVEILKANGFVAVSLDKVQRGDVLWRAGHTEMYLGDGMQGGAVRSENHSIHGKVGDQDGMEIRRCAYNRGEWTSAWRCTKARTVPTPSAQPESEPKNDIGIRYRMHVEGDGWLPAVHDGQTAGTVGAGKRGEALKIVPPDGVHLDVTVHVQGRGDIVYDDLHKGKSSPVMGTVGNGLRLEAVKIGVTKLPDALKGKTLYYRAHVEGLGWQKAVKSGKWAGTRGLGKRLEALQIWFK